MHINLRLQIINLLPHIQELSRELDAIGQVVGAAAPLPLVGARSAARVVGGAVAERVAAAGEEPALCARAGDGVRHPCGC